MNLVVLESTEPTNAIPAVDDADVLVRCVGLNVDVLRPSSISRRHLTKTDSDSLLAQRLPVLFGQIDHRLQAKALHQVCGLPLWELVKDSLYADFRARFFSTWAVAYCLSLGKFKSVCLVSRPGMPSTFALALERASHHEGIRFKKVLLGTSTSRRSPSSLARRVADRVLWSRGVISELIPTRQSVNQSAILFSAFYPTNAWLLSAMRRAMPSAQRSKITMFSGSFPLWKQLAKRSHAPVLSPWCFSDLSLVRGARANAHAVNLLLQQPLDTGSSQFELDSAIVEFLIRWVRERYYGVVWSVNANLRLFRAVKPNAVATTTQWSVPGKAHVMVAQFLCEVPTLWIQHGLATLDPLDTPMHCARLLVWGAKDVDLWTSAGVAADRIQLTGGINFDNLAGLTCDADRLRKSIGVQTDAPVAVFATQPPGSMISTDESAEVLNWVLQAASFLPDVQFVVKPHPAERKKDYLPSIQSHGLANVHLRTDEVNALIADADVVLTIFSTVGMSAIALRKPLITLRVPGVAERAPYFAEGVAVSASSVHELISAIRAALAERAADSGLESRRAAFIHNYMGKLDGRAAARCAEQVLDLVQSAVPIPA